MPNKWRRQRTERELIKLAKREKIDVSDIERLVKAGNFKKLGGLIERRKILQIFFTENISKTLRNICGTDETYALLTERAKSDAKFARKVLFLTRQFINLEMKKQKRARQIEDEGKDLKYDGPYKIFAKQSHDAFMRILNYLQKKQIRPTPFDHPHQP